MPPWEWRNGIKAVETLPEPESKTKVGYKINFNCYFYKYTPSRLLDEIETDLKKIEKEIAEMLEGVTE